MSAKFEFSAKPETSAIRYEVEDTTLSGPDSGMDLSALSELRFYETRAHDRIKRHLHLKTSDRQELTVACEQIVHHLENDYDMSQFRHLAAEVARKAYDLKPALPATLGRREAWRTILFFVGILIVMLGLGTFTWSLFAGLQGVAMTLILCLVIVGFGGLMMAGNAPWQSEETIGMKAFIEMMDDLDSPFDDRY